MNKRTNIELMMFVLLVSMGAALRVAFADTPNFAPISALALFAGFFFRSWTVALAVPLLAMATSQGSFGIYHPLLMVSVYSMLALPVTCRSLLRRYCTPDANMRAPSILTSWLGWLGCALVFSIAFFLVTNFSCWLIFQGYPHTLTGLLQCYQTAIPFFRYTFAGDMLFTTVFFGIYALITSLGYLPKRDVLYNHGVGSI